MKSNNYCVIMAGGVGSRFWPMSTPQKPKQFLDVLGTGKSLIQMTYDRLLLIAPKENIYILTNESYAGIVKEQLPDLTYGQILTEPMRKNTAPCIAYAAAKIHDLNPEATMVISPADHLIVRENRFSEDFTTQLLTAPSASNPTEIYTIELIPKEDTPIVWGKIISKSRSDLIPLEVQYFDEDGTLKRIDKFEDVKEYDGVLMPTKFSVIPQDKQGEITTMTYVTVDFQTPVSEDMFSLQALRK